MSIWQNDWYTRYKFAWRVCSPAKGMGNDSEGNGTQCSRGASSEMSPDPASSGDEDAREEKRRCFAEKRKSHYQMREALRRCGAATRRITGVCVNLNDWAMYALLLQS